jgi:hypothetical protein
MRQDAVSRLGDRLLDEPVSRKALPVPREARTQIRDDFGIARRCEQPGLYLLEITCELIEAVCVVAKQITLDEHVGHSPRAIASQPGPFQKRSREQHELVGAISIPQGS